MKLTVGRIVAIALVFGITSIGWLTLAGVTSHRADTLGSRLGPEVAELWGQPHRQGAPEPTFLYETERATEKTIIQDGQTQTIQTREVVLEERPVLFSRTRVAADLHLDPRQRGLVWFSLYGVDFEGAWTYTHRASETGRLRLRFAFPDPQGLYDGFRFVVNGENLAARLQPRDGVIETLVPVAPGAVLNLEVGYRSRGLESWSYQPTRGVASLEDFEVQVSTDFEGFDYPNGAVSPTARTPRDGGMQLDWRFDQVVTGQSMGVTMPSIVQPGELATALSMSAPVSLFFFFFVLLVLSTVRGIDIHPINHLFLGGAFFAFHLLFAYGVDHLDVVPAFVLASIVSLVLVVSYLRLVVGNRFAFVEATIAQLVYLVGFSLAHFWEGFTGLTVTVLSIVTLFVAMQLTGRIRWSDVLSRSAERPTPREVPTTSAV